MVKQSYLACTAALLVALVACEQSTGPSTGLSQADANQLAADMDAVATLGTSDFGLGPSFSISTDGGASVTATPTTFSNTFDVTKPCPKGGTVQIVGSANGTGDRTTHSLTLETTATRTDKDCAFETRRGIVTLNGNPNIVYTANLNIVNGALSGLQTATHKGAFTWARAGTPGGDCVVDLTSSFDPATHTATVKGEFCGHIVDVTRTRGG
jgi:hypothetical protein